MRLKSTVQAKNSKPNLKRLARAGDIDGLGQALEYREIVAYTDGARLDLGVPVRMSAIAILAHSSDPRAQEALLTGLVDEVADVRLAALRAVRDQRDERVIDALARRLAAAPARHRRFGSETQQRVGEATLAWRDEALRALVERDDPLVLEKVASYMVQRAGDAPLEGSDLDVVRALQSTSRVRAAHPELAERLTEWLGHENAIVVGRSAQVLTALGESALAALVRALEDPERRVAALGAMGQLRDKSVSSSISLYADDPDPNVRRLVMEVLGQIRDPGAVRPLLNGANDPVYEVRAAACSALDDVGTAAVIVAFTSIVGPALERIADTTELNRAIPRVIESDAQDRADLTRGIPRRTGGSTDSSASTDQGGPLPAEATNGRPFTVAGEPIESRSGLRHLFDVIVSGRTAARERRRPRP